MQTQTSQKKKTRADFYRDRVQVRIAVDDCGPEIGRLLSENGVVLPDESWASVFPNWLIATDGDQIIGCIQVMPVKPIGWCSCLYVLPSAGFKLRAIAIRKLIAAGMSTCYTAGCAYVGGMMDTRNVKFSDVLTKLNFVRGPDHMLMLKRLDVH